MINNLLTFFLCKFVKNVLEYLQHLKPNFYIGSFFEAVQDFAVAGIHTSPKDASNEINHLTKVYDAIKSKWQLDDVIIMGDLNAGCDFVKDWSQISLATDRRFYWVIDHSVDTTTGRTDCPYDRIVVSGNKLLKNILPHSAGIFNFDEEYGLTNSQVCLFEFFF